MDELRRVPCKSCGAEMVWAETEKGKRLPLDAEPTPGGSFRIAVEAGKVRAIYHRNTVGMKRTDLHVPHWATCPHSAQHRKPRS